MILCCTRNLSGNIISTLDPGVFQELTSLKLVWVLLRLICTHVNKYFKKKKTKNTNGEHEWKWNVFHKVSTIITSVSNFNYLNVTVETNGTKQLKTLGVSITPHFPYIVKRTASVSNCYYLPFISQAIFSRSFSLKLWTALIKLTTFWFTGLLPKEWDNPFLWAVNNVSNNDLVCFMCKSG